MFLALSLLFATAFAQDVFIFPSQDGVNVTADNSVTVEWTSNAGSLPINLTLYQNAGQSGDAPADNPWFSQVLLDQVPDPGSYVWKPTTLQGLPISDGFHFEVSYGSGHGFNSGALFIVNSISTTSTTTTTSTPSSTPPPITTPTPSPSSAAVQQSSSTNKTALGVGLGLGLFFLLVIVGAFYIFLLRRRKPKSRVQYAEIQQRELIESSHSRSELDTMNEVHEVPTALPEMQADDWRHELSG